MAYTSSCQGQYIGEYVMRNPEELNKLLGEGYSLLDARKATQKGGVVFQSDFYPIYRYEVNGVEYIRASRQLHGHFGNSIGRANLWMKGTSCNVLYDPENPGDSVIEGKNGETRSAFSSKTIWIILAVIAAVFFFFGFRIRFH